MPLAAAAACNGLSRIHFLQPSRQWHSVTRHTCRHCCNAAGGRVGTGAEGGSGDSGGEARRGGAGDAGAQGYDGGPGAPASIAMDLRVVHCLLAYHFR